MNLGDSAEAPRCRIARLKLMGGAVTTSLSRDGVFVHPHGLCESDDVGHEHAFIGAGAVVTSDVTAHGFVRRQPGSADRLGLHLW